MKHTTSNDHTEGLGLRPSLTVLQQVNAPTPKTNPYLVQLFGALTPLVHIRYWSLRTALLSRYDVVHLHWPEYMMRHHSVVGRLLRQCAVAVLLMRWTLLRTPVVRTLHNLAPHEGGGRFERALLGWMDRLTTRWIRINATTELRDPGTDTALHGHYRDWYAQMERPQSKAGRLLHFGLIRPYKGVEVLMAAMSGLRTPGCRLRIVGNPASDAMRTVVEHACEEDARISALLQYVDDPTLAREVSEAELVVLPYREMHNSGTLLLSLSLDRPVLVPHTENNAAVAEEVGDGWVLMYDGELTAEVLEDGLRRARSLPRRRHSDLSQRDWARAGERHYRSYAAAIRQRLGRRSVARAASGAKATTGRSR
ncbi:beta-1,4-mannosyltransferase&|uniref:glycosyltransferase n=1 Tax=Pseudoxanthomonas sp. GM95 TaxID=1881043 RepID=UPI0008D55073|nr:glycosyltransferase [Pseudoxanthomonas sp. GM95]SEK80575.1 beta-1,4-mannosyltransferase&\